MQDTMTTKSLIENIENLSLELRERHVHLTARTGRADERIVDGNVRGRDIDIQAQYRAQQCPQVLTVAIAVARPAAVPQAAPEQLVVLGA